MKIADEKHSQQAFLAVQENYLLINNFYEGKGTDAQADGEPIIEDQKYEEGDLG